MLDLHVELRAHNVEVHLGDGLTSLAGLVDCRELRFRVVIRDTL